MKNNIIPFPKTKIKKIVDVSLQLQEQLKIIQKQRKEILHQRKQIEEMREDD